MINIENRIPDTNVYGFILHEILYFPKLNRSDDQFIKITQRILQKAVINNQKKGQLK